jgi:hypothetical protein
VGKARFRRRRHDRRSSGERHPPPVVDSAILDPAATPTAVTDQMRAACLIGHGGPECIVVRPTPKPARKPGEAFVRIRAGGLNRVDLSLGMSGARLARAAALELKRQGGRYGLATMCVGVGQGVAMAIERVSL